uniref:Alpha-1,3-mannosyl-glycoprotein 2-beta-N-acetylglucosaminyltransferase n=1 Tax=Ascaris suum TaxID=6253 RepID=F1KYW1_ASCSU
MTSYHEGNSISGSPIGNAVTHVNEPSVCSSTRTTMNIISFVPTKIRRRLCGSVTRRRLITLGSLLAVAFLFLHEGPVFSSSDEKPQMNDRRILESDGVVVVPQIVDAVGASWKRSEEHKEANHPKDMLIFKTENKIKDEKALVAEVHNGRRSEVVSEGPPVTVVLVMCATRPLAIKNHLEQIIRLRPSVESFPIVVSQDGNVASVTDVIKEFINETTHVSFIHHSERTGEKSGAAKAAKNYFFIAQHYKWALDKVFFEMHYDTAIVTEDDLDIAEDFFSYFSATRYLLRSDPSIWCISAWNDNGGNNITDRSRSDRLYRTDFFPGLGWMLNVDLWKELSPKWPLTYWDDWLRRQDIRSNRACIRPEVSRTAHNLKVAGKGTSGGLYKKYLASIHLPESPIDFSLLDLSYLTKNNYDRILRKRLSEANEISVEMVENLLVPSAENSYIVVYRTPREYRRIARAVGLMIDIRSGMPRTAYYGVVTFLLGVSRIYAIPAALNENLDFISQPSSAFYNTDWDKMTRYLDFQETYCRPGKFTGACDPNNPELKEWFKKKRLTKRLQSWGEMIVN